MHITSNHKAKPWFKTLKTPHSLRALIPGYPAEFIWYWIFVHGWRTTEGALTFHARVWRFVTWIDCLGGHQMLGNVFCWRSR